MSLISNDTENMWSLEAKDFLEYQDKLVGVSPRFVMSLSQAHSSKEVLSVASSWLPRLMAFERASITVPAQEGYLSLYAVEGNQAIPRNVPLPIDFTMVGQVFAHKKLMLCHDLAIESYQDCRMLYEGGLSSCMDAPMIYRDKCVGTLNVARTDASFSQDEAMHLFALASLIAMNLD
ncbi:GAF domain-containing protein [Pseudoalteromonas sp. SSDWG2]|uniref:GAF domain-containing protein n=1 Tax=Pseudoalteromonas sp. SSDWG2 TaxID=3139391 RepID=UPI003BAABB68